MAIVLLAQVYLWLSEPFDLHAVQTILLAPYSNLPHLKNKGEKTFWLGAIFILRKGILRFFEQPTHLRKDIFTK